MIAIIIEMFCFDLFIQIEIDARGTQMEGILLTPICRQFKCYFINGRGDVSVKTFIFALFMPWASLIVIVTHKLKIK